MSGQCACGEPITADGWRVLNPNCPIHGVPVPALSRPQAPTDRDAYEGVIVRRLRELAKQFSGDTRQLIEDAAEILNEPLPPLVQAPTDQRIAEIRAHLDALGKAALSDGCVAYAEIMRQASDALTVLQQRVDELTTLNAQWQRDEEEEHQRAEELQQRVDELRFSLTAAEKRATEAEQRGEQLSKELAIARDIKALADSEDRILKNYDAEVQRLEEVYAERLSSAEQRLETAERERYEALAATKAESLAHLAEWFNERTILIGSLCGEKQRAEVIAVTERVAKEAAEATIARLKSAVESIREDLNNAYGSLPAVIEAQFDALASLPSSSVRTAETGHVCGLAGYNGMIDPPCPACEARSTK